LISRKGRSIATWVSCSIDDVCSIFIKRVTRGVKGITEITRFINISRTESRSLETQRKIGDFSIVIKIREKVISHRGNFTHIKASGWESREISICIEGIKETTFHFSTKIIGIKASSWEIRQCSIGIKSVKEICIFCSNITRIETSCW